MSLQEHKAVTVHDTKKAIKHVAMLQRTFLTASFFIRAEPNTTVKMNRIIEIITTETCTAPTPSAAFILDAT